MLQYPCPLLNFPMKLELYDDFYGECLKNVLKVSESVSYFCPFTRFQALSKADFLTDFPSVGDLNWVADHKIVFFIFLESCFK